MSESSYMMVSHIKWGMLAAQQSGRRYVHYRLFFDIGILMIVCETHGLSNHQEIGETFATLMLGKPVPVPKHYQDEWKKKERKK